LEKRKPMTTDGSENRKTLRTALTADVFFNILESPDDYGRGQTSILKRLGVIDALKAPPARTESQILLTRIDQKLSILITILAEHSGRKKYDNHASVVDVSETGLGFVHTMQLKKGTILEMGLQLSMGDNNRIIDLAGKIVNLRKQSESEDGLVIVYGVEFFDVLGKDQNDILQWIFAHQREQIRRRRERDVS